MTRVILLAVLVLVPAALQPAWPAGIEGQRKADLGNGFYLNPIFAGDHPDPSILKDGADYYMTFSTFDAYPGLVVWHSRDLVNWQPVGPALFKNVGSVWAPDLVKHQGRYYIYFPGVGPYRSNYVVWADSIRGPWSEPIDLKIGRIDPGHAVGTDGRRYLFMSNGEIVPLAADGLSATAPMRRIYEGWRYPDDWVVESFSQEGPKIVKRGEYYYMVLAEGGTAGPPTGHMIIAARSKTIDGPWENAPHNPILRTTSPADRWWSKGHGSLVEGPGGQWFMIYHAYENGFYTLGRQTLLEPIEWTADGWFRMAGADAAKPIRMPGPSSGSHGLALSDNFSTNKMGIQWGFYAGTDVDRARFRYDSGRLVLKARGQSPADSSPLSFVTGDHAYEVEVTIDADPDATAGLLFYSRRLYAGLGVSPERFILHRYGTERSVERPASSRGPIRLRLRNDRHIVTIHYSADGKTWSKFGTGMEVSGYHHNVAGEFLSLRPAIYAAGSGEVRFSDFRYKALR
jgi:beta-xylosidase